MHKAGAFAFVFASVFLLLSGCNGAYLSVNQSFPTGSGGKLKDEAKPSPQPSPEEDPKAPGMIPQECEALLNRSRDWGFEPEKSWTPATPAIALEAVRFFSTFHLVPESSSTFAKSWLQELVPASSAKAKRSLDRMDRAQSCDFLLAHKLVLALLQYRWPKADRPAAAQAIESFVMAQQDRISSSPARAVQIDVLGKAVNKGFVRADPRAVAELRKWFDDKTAGGLSRAEEATDALEQWKLNRDELLASEEARFRLGRILSAH